MAHAEKAPQTSGKTIGWSRFYDAASWLMSFGQIGRIRKDIITAAEAKPGEEVLDVGCGTGTLALALKERVGAEGEVHGIDASPQMIEVAHKKATKGADVDFRVALVEDLPFEDARFDLVTSTLMLHHLPDDLKRRGLSEVRRVLKPNGRVLIVDFAKQPGSFLGVLLALLPGHVHTMGSVTGIKSILTESGFGTVEQLPSRFGQLMFLRARP